MTMYGDPRYFDPYDPYGLGYGAMDPYTQYAAQYDPYAGYSPWGPDDPYALGGNELPFGPAAAEPMAAPQQMAIQPQQMIAQPQQMIAQPQQWVVQRWAPRPFARPPQVAWDFPMPYARPPIRPPQVIWDYPPPAFNAPVGPIGQMADPYALEPMAAPQQWAVQPQQMIAQPAQWVSTQLTPLRFTRPVQWGVQTLIPQQWVVRPFARPPQVIWDYPAPAFSGPVGPIGPSADPYALEPMAAPQQMIAQPAQWVSTQLTPLRFTRPTQWGVQTLIPQQWVVRPFARPPQVIWDYPVPAFSGPVGPIGPMADPYAAEPMAAPQQMIAQPQQWVSTQLTPLRFTRPTQWGVQTLIPQQWVVRPFARPPQVIWDYPPLAFNTPVGPWG